MKRVLLTGASGFVGSFLLPRLLQDGLSVVVAGRRRPAVSTASAVELMALDLADPQHIAALDLHGVDTVCHMAARVHVMNSAADDANLFDLMNVQATRTLARACVASGVRRFVFVSSIKVNGERTEAHAFRADEMPAPEDAYARSKWQAEQALAEVAGRGDLDVVIVRPPLVYGPGVSANFLRLIQLVHSGWPLPLAALNNKRSLINVWNLVDFLREAVTGKTVSAGTWLVSDGEDASTPALISHLAAGLGREARMWPVPASALTALASLLGRGEQMRRLVESLQVDITPTLSATAWRPRLSLREGLRRTAQWYLSRLVTR